MKEWPRESEVMILYHREKNNFLIQSVLGIPIDVGRGSLVMVASSGHDLN